MSDTKGYVYRVASASTEKLRSLIKTHVGERGWSFGGASLWDFDTSDRSNNLRTIVAFTDSGAVSIEGDFGHAFSEQAEVRWKRRDDGAYDVLIIGEKPQTVQEGEPVHTQVWDKKTSSWKESDWNIAYLSRAKIMQTAGYSPISYVEYLASNGSVQFQRLLRCNNE